jgi:addiction module RelE/StbE family toxin
VAKVVWTEQAYEDLEAIFEYISHDSLKYAQLLIEKILMSVKRLEIFPESGRIVSELNEKHIRELIVGNYRIIYRTKHECVEILTVRHSATKLNLSNIQSN